MRAGLSSLLFVSLLMGAVGLSSPLFAAPLMGGMRGYLPRFFVPVDGEMILHKEKTAEAVFSVVSGSQ